MKMKNWWSHVKPYINAEKFTRVAIVVVAVVLIFFIVVILKPDWFPQFPMVRETVIATSTTAMVLATLILAYATFRMIRNSNEQEKRRREEDLLKEKRDRDAGLINEIINWAIGIDKCNFPLGTKDVEPSDLKKVKLSIKGHINELLFNTNEMIGKGRYINIIASILGQELQDAVVKLNDELYNHAVLLNEFFEAVDKKFDEFVAKTAEVRKHFWDTLDKSANEVIAKATKIKTRDIS